MFNVFNFILPTFESESSFIQLTMITAITKIYFKINNESKSKIKPLLQHIFALCTNINSYVNLDVRCRVIMYQRLLKYDINAAKKIVLTNVNINNKNESKTIANDIQINYKIDHDLGRLSGIYNKKESEFIDRSYAALGDSDSRYYTEEEYEIVLLFYLNLVKKKAADTI